jgi:hypothetical protein
MAINPKSLPTKEDAIEFAKLVDSARVKTRNALANVYILDVDEEVREQITNHSVYKWVRSHRDFHGVIRRLKEKGTTGEYPLRLEIEIACCIARILHMYIIFKLHPERMKRTTAASATKALKHIKELQILLQADIQMENFMEKVELSILLEKLNLELLGDTTTTYRKSKRGDVLARRLVVELYQLLNGLLGDVVASEISDLVSIMHPVKEQSARRYIKNLSVKS